MGSSAATLTNRLAHALNYIQTTRPLKVRASRRSGPSARVAAPPVRHASVAILIRVQPTLEDEETLAEQYDADGQPISGTDAARALQQLCPPPSVLGSSVAGSQSDTASSSEVLTTASGTKKPAAPVNVVQTFFALPWVQRGTPEIFFIERPARGDDSSASQLAFPGGRREDEDENGLYTALRETWQETGIDLAESKDFACIGQLDQREITTSMGQKLLMILSPYVFLQTTPFSPHPDLSPTEVAAAHWVPLSVLEDAPPSAHSTTTVDVAHRLAPKSAAVRWTLRTLIGCLDYHALLVPNDPVAEAFDMDRASQHASEADGASSSSDSQVLDLPEYPSLAHHHRTYLHAAARPATVVPSSFLGPTGHDDRPPVKLWGLTLAMTLDLISHFPPKASSRPERLPAPAPSPDTDIIAWALFELRAWVRVHRPRPAWQQAPTFAPAAAFPRFTYPDINFWIWTFGWHYRSLLDEWEKTRARARSPSSSLRPPPKSSTRGLPPRSSAISQVAIGAYYLAMRRALLVSVLLRGVGALSTVMGTVFLLLRRLARRRRGLSGWGLDHLLRL